MDPLCFKIVLKTSLFFLDLNYQLIGIDHLYRLGLMILIRTKYFLLWKSQTFSKLKSKAIKYIFKRGFLYAAAI